ncbi:SDR family oxidoreductase [Janthinobacterium sp. 17J80-10]|uniref:SDR family oxidoreductase n=1 Tax=Janthinobacterium sp. 17J80-10 TaxID=2497863 RepID=UPI00100557A5|nr:SDR family oxidoreductase [Janthinobacterium sp. 17J80-10]QAU34129.1 SDR family oxidoreductase [Janthinobacterium sp. 17J80-10]
MKLTNATIFITGSNRGLGLAFARMALARGARKVYAAARDPSQVSLPGVVPIKLDVTNEQEVEAAALQCTDVTLVINNAGIANFGGFLAPDSVDAARRHLETNFFGVLNVSRAFAPILKRNGGGALLNVLSVASWISRPELAAYGASKSAAWSLTNGLRHELQAQNTQVLGLHVGFIDTDLTRDIDAPKVSPELVAAYGYDALERGDSEALVDDITRKVKQGLAAEPAIYIQNLAA